MADPRPRSESSFDVFELARCCVEAQADGRDGPLPPIRPVGRD